MTPYKNDGGLHPGPITELPEVIVHRAAPPRLSGGPVVVSQRRVHVPTCQGFDDNFANLHVDARFFSRLGTFAEDENGIRALTIAGGGMGDLAWLELQGCPGGNTRAGIVANHADGRPRGVFVNGSFDENHLFSGYVLRYESVFILDWMLERWDAGIPSDLLMGAGWITPANGETLSIEWNANTLSVYRDASLADYIEDATYTGGSCGLVIGDTTGRITGFVHTHL